MRCLHESQMWEEKAFVTLTYRDEELPKDGVSKRELQLFLKRLRKRWQKPLKYYGCGEYGEKTGRSHYHLIVFGVPCGSHQKGIPIGKNIWKQCWKKGNVYLGNVSSDSIRYVAQYIDKKMYSDLRQERNQEFQICSQGIGLSWLKENYVDVLYDAGCTYRGVAGQIPRYYMKKLEGLFPEALDGVRDRLAERRNVADADLSLELSEQLGGRTFKELTLLERHEYVRLLTERGRSVDRTLREQGKLNSLKKRSKRI